MGKRAERISSEELYEQIQALSPEPFRDLLTRVLNAEPSQKALQAFADKHPDRWGQLVAIVAKPAGYSDKDRPSTEVNIYAQINQMSDAEIMVYIENEMRKVGVNMSALDLIRKNPGAVKLVEDISDVALHEEVPSKKPGLGPGDTH